jgi:light-regulated signal transduction histidine kinase (bacteriophytochrome)
MPQFDVDGNLRMWVGTSSDIHDQKAFAKELEEKVFERTKELKEINEVLEKNNRDLEQFAYIASHDLQEPLRKIQTFSDILKKNMHDEVSVQKYFTKIDLSARRMSDLIRSVLDYSRIPPHPNQLILADLNEIVEHVKSDFELTISEKNAVVESNELPAIPGVRLQLQQLFANLIGNGLKFCKQSPRITIVGQAVAGSELTNLFNADRDKQYVQLRFSDNGIGFETRYREQIFTILAPPWMAPILRNRYRTGIVQEDR